MEVTSDSYDSPWKDVLEEYLPDFFRLFLPEVHREVDWQRPPLSLEKELRKIVRDAELGTRFADKLFQVWTKSGDPLEVMINIEVQGSATPDFAKRIYVYNYRTFDRFDRPVVSIAVLCDDSESFHPTEFKACDLWGCRASLEFPTVKLREYNSRWDELEADANPFATVTMAHLKTTATRRRPKERYRWKLTLIRRLYEKGYDKEDVLKLFRFIDWIMALPKELENRLDQDIEAIESEKNMPYVTGIERRALQRGIEQGIQQGIKQGIEKGIQKGIQKGVQQGARDAEMAILRDMLAEHLAPELPGPIEQRIEAASSEQLRSWVKRVPKADTLEDIFD